MKKTIISLWVTVCGLSFFQSASAQVIYSDDFTSDSSLAQPPWYNLNNTSDVNYQFVEGTGLELVQTSGTGKVNEMYAEFNPVTLSQGDSLTLTVDFDVTSSGSASSGEITDTGALLAGLYNNNNENGSPANEQGSSGGSAVAGPTSPSSGYFGDIGYTTSAGLSSKFDARTGSATVNNELGYYSDMSGSSYSQIGSFAAGGNANLNLATEYTLEYTVADNGASENTITAEILQGATVLDDFVSNDSTGDNYDAFNELDFGVYAKAETVDVDMLDASITETAVPEPSAIALLGAGLGLIGLIRFRRR